jgi:hypothetical protein
VEPGVAWQPTGVPASPSPHAAVPADCGSRIASRGRDLAIARVFGIPNRTAALPDDLLGAEVDSLYVSVYLYGQMRGCFGTAIRRLDHDLATVVEAALDDSRFPASGAAGLPAAISVTVSLLHDRLALGEHSVQDVVRRIRYGQHALMVEQDGRMAVYLPSVASRYSIGAVAFAEELLHKAGITGPPYRWTRFECTTWLADQAGQRLVEGSFAPEAPPAKLTDLLGRLIPLGIGYLLRHQRSDGSFFTRYEPLHNRLYEGIDLPRLAHAAWVLARIAGQHDASASDAARRSLTFLLDTLRETGDGWWLVHAGNDRSVAEIALLVLALCEGSELQLRDLWVPRLTALLWSRIDVHGRIHTHADDAVASDAYQDYFPGQVLLALAAATRAGLTAVDETKVARAFRYYRHRFHVRPHFGQVSWLAQSCCAWNKVAPDREIADLAFEVADWILGFQQHKTGAFLNDHQSDTPGYTTALYLEALGVAAALARSMGKEQLHLDYLEACRRGLQFLDGLIIQPRDQSLLPNPALAIGGLRRSARASEICIDFVQHYLAASTEIVSAAAYNPAHRDRAAISTHNSA